MHIVAFYRCVICRGRNKDIKGATVKVRRSGVKDSNIKRAETKIAQHQSRCMAETRGLHLCGLPLEVTDTTSSATKSAPQILQEMRMHMENEKRSHQRIPIPSPQQYFLMSLLNLSLGDHRELYVSARTGHLPPRGKSFFPDIYQRRCMYGYTPDGPFGGERETEKDVDALFAALPSYYYAEKEKDFASDYHVRKIRRIGKYKRRRNEAYPPLDKLEKRVPYMIRDRAMLSQKIDII